MDLVCCQSTWAGFSCVHHIVLTCALAFQLLSYSSLHPACPAWFLAYLWKCFLNEWPNIYQFKPGLAYKHSEDWGQGNVVHFCYKVLTYCTQNHSASWFFLTSYVIIPTKTLGARKGYNGLGSFEQFNIFITSNLGYFHYERDDWFHVRQEESEDGPFPRKSTKTVPGL